MSTALAILTACYGLLMILYLIGWKGTRFFKIKSGAPKTSISVIIPARNEAGNIGICIHSILANNYPQELLEIIVVDDHSEDNTAAVVRTIGRDNVRCIALKDYLNASEQTVAYKKKALAAGISVSKGALIVTTDADCLAPAGWLQNIAAIYEEQQPVMVVAPVDFTSDNSVVQLFQSLDFMTMQGITAATLRLGLGNMCNGANLAFSKKAFVEVGGYTGTESMASGDDYLLMTKFSKAFPGRISYLKTKAAIMRTAPQPDWYSFFQQRIRWASKSGKYQDNKLTAVLMIVYAYNFALLVLLLYGIFSAAAMKVVLSLILLKTILELIFLFPIASFFDKKRDLLFFPFLQPLHIAYIVSAGFLGFFGNYRWKGRDLK